MTFVFVKYSEFFVHLDESVWGEVGLEHAPGAGQVLVREDQEALAGPKKYDVVNPHLQTSDTYSKLRGKLGGLLF